jgi:hypothetical protein
MKEQKDAPKETLNGTAAGPIFLSSRWEANRSDFSGVWDSSESPPPRAIRGMNPGDELQAAIGGIQAKKARADLIQLHGPCQEWLSKGSIMDIGRRKDSSRYVRGAPPGPAGKGGGHR